ncbi:MAG: class I SAM-dependent methyltransferase [Nitrososphaerales archaeon]
MTGVDKSATMPRRAQRNADERGVMLRLRKTSLEKLDVVGEFDAAYSVFSVFNYILHEDQLRKTLSKLRTLILPGGLLVLDMGNFASLFGRYKKVIAKERRGRGWSIRRRVTH